jgi:putative ATPase
MSSSQPLADRMRPKSLEDFVGQEHLVGPDAILRKNISTGNIHSFILWGPPGVGKTTLAKIIANQQNRPFHGLSAVNSGVKDIRETIDKAKSQKFFNSLAPILFIDEIHRFSKSQQDSLLAAVEQGIVVLIGATTENPSFEVISPLLSRCQVYILKSLGKADLINIVERAIKQDYELKQKNITIEEYEAMLRFSGGDARKLLNILEIVVQSNPDETAPIVINNQKVIECIQEKMALYDKQGEQHYDIISAFIKSMRGSDPNGAVYWLARMLEGGEDIEFIARRMIILAAEDIGLANPNALLLANSCFQAIHTIGMPEARIILSEAAIYLATSPKSNSAYLAIESALGIAKEKGDLPVPLHIRNAPTSLMKELGYGEDYKYAHEYENNFIELEFLPSEISRTSFFEPGNNPKEEEIRQRMRQLWKEKYGF